MSDDPVSLLGPHIQLRELRLDDWRDIHRYAARLEVCRFQAWGPNTPAESQAFVGECVRAAQEQPRTRFALGVTLLGAQPVIGVGELHVRSFRFRSGEIAYGLHPDFWGQGIGTEVARLLLHLGFEHLHLHRISATCDPRNAASARVLQKVGMAYEGRMRGTLLIRDGWRDSELYAILESDERR
jgi:ribosomal-protein-alanine N-acetyltransferase